MRHLITRPRTERRPSRRLAVAGAAGVLLAALVPASQAASAAAFTTINPSVDGPGRCLNGSGLVNCNIYTAKQYVWTNGGSAGALLGDGTYYFAVVRPGGQSVPVDGSPGLLSSDAYTNRTFSVASGVVTYSGTHTQDGPLLRMAPFADAPHGVYIAVICRVVDGAQTSECKSDAFKAPDDEEGGPGGEEIEELSVVGFANGAFTTAYAWDVEKTASPTVVRQVGGGTAPVGYTLDVTRDTGTATAHRVTGTITAMNSGAPAPGIVVGASVDPVPPATSGTPCVVTDTASVPLSGPVTLPTGDSEFLFGCTGTDPLATTVTVTLADEGPRAGFTDAFVYAEDGTTGACARIVDTRTDTANPTPPSVTNLGPTCGSQQYTYTADLVVPTNGCSVHHNVAVLTDSASASTELGRDDATVTTCGPALTGARTKGFWQNKNGQGIITGQAAAGTCPSATWLRNYAPVQDLSAAATCKQTAAYVLAVIKAADSSGASMDKMLKAQMLATALDVYFSDPALGGNKLLAPAPIGGLKVDLTYICKSVGRCAGSFYDTSSSFGGTSPQTVSALLTYAAGQSNVGGTVWYGNLKPVQEKAKDTFDAINNQVVFALP